MKASSIYRAQQVAPAALSIDARQSSLASQIASLGKQMQLSDAVVQRAQDLATKAWSKRGEGNTAILAAGCIYVACRALGTRVSQFVIAEQARIGPGALFRSSASICALLGISFAKETPSAEDAGKFISPILESRKIDAWGRLNFKGHIFKVPALANLAVKIQDQGATFRIISLDGATLGTINFATKQLMPPENEISPRTEDSQ